MDGKIALPVKQNYCFLVYCSYANAVKSKYKYLIVVYPLLLSIYLKIMLLSFRHD